LNHKFAFKVTNLKYKKISHFAIPMRRNTWLLKLLFKTERKYPEECSSERRDLTDKTIDFIQSHW